MVVLLLATLLFLFVATTGGEEPTQLSSHARASQPGDAAGEGADVVVWVEGLVRVELPGMAVGPQGLVPSGTAQSDPPHGSRKQPEVGAAQVGEVDRAEAHHRTREFDRTVGPPEWPAWKSGPPEEGARARKDAGGVGEAGLGYEGNRPRGCRDQRHHRCPVAGDLLSGQVLQECSPASDVGEEVLRPLCRDRDVGPGVEADLVAVAGSATYEPGSSFGQLADHEDGRPDLGGGQHVQRELGHGHDPLLHADRLRVVTIGDSVAFDGEPGIRAALEATGAVGVDTWSFGGVGLLRPGFDDYLDDILDGGPEVVVVMLGGWDLDGLVPDPAAYGRRLDDVADRMAGRGATVLLLGMPPAPPREGIEAARLVANGQFAALAGRRSDVRYLDTGLALGGPGGGFARFRVGLGGTVVQVRKVRGGWNDGHLCPGGAALLGDLVLGALRADHDIGDPSERWWEDAWTSDARYDDPPGGCDASAD